MGVLANWLERLDYPVIFWGWRNDENSTMAFEYETIKRGLEELGFKATWITANDSPAARDGGRIIFLGQTLTGAQIDYAPALTERDVIVHHNTTAIAGPGHHICWFYFHAAVEDAGAVILPYPCDLEPVAISKLTINKNNSLAFFVGSHYSGGLDREHAEIRAQADRHNLSYLVSQSWNESENNQNYLLARFAPVPQLDNLGAFLPSRIIKAMARGCIPMFTSKYLPHLLGPEGAQGCINKPTWEDVFDVAASMTITERDDIARWNMEHAAKYSVREFLGALWPRGESRFLRWKGDHMRKTRGVISNDSKDY